MGILKKIVKGVGSVLGLGGQTPKMPEIKTPAQQLERQSEVGAEDITMGADDETSTTKGKRALLRPTTSTSLGGV